SKPDGIGVVPATKTREYLAPLPINVIWGVGPKLNQRLINANIQTVGELAQQDPVRMKRWLGTIGPQIVGLARGEDARAVEPHHDTKSVSVEHTFEQDVLEADQLEKFLLDLSYECARRMRHDGLVAWGLCVKVKDTEIVARTKSTSLKTPATSGAVFFKVIRPLLNELMSKRSHPVRLLGVRADRVAEPNAEQELQETLFDLDETPQQIDASQDWYSTDQILDDVARKF